MKDIQLSDYTYNLPQEKIASYGLVKRDQSKLLFYCQKRIKHNFFHQLPTLIPHQSTLFFNNTKVIQARLKLKRKTGAVIEVFLLSPESPQETIQDSLKSTKPVIYQCMVGNLKKWKDNEILSEKIKIGNREIALSATLVDRHLMLVKFSWKSNSITFFDILEHIGHTPLPPYINRADEPEDRERYQTVYSKNPGAVAAPTAGLHFTKEILEKLEANGNKINHLTLHVSAGTFKPIKVNNVTDHPMHSERIIINRGNIEALITANKVTAVGTTALRTLESTYWYGVQVVLTQNYEFKIAKLAPYQDYSKALPTRKDAFKAVLSVMEQQNINEIHGETEIFIVPGYEFKVCDALITNFHQPNSTLILLVAAFIGENWRQIYEEALQNNYRFLSYGDSSLLVRE